MQRALIAGLVVCLGAYSALAASPKIEAAVKTFKAVGADPAKLKTFCAMSKAMDEAGDKQDQAAEAKIMGFMKQLGPDFETAWSAADGVDDSSADGKAYLAGLDELADKCPQ
jgi:hypothetical protein